MVVFVYALYAYNSNSNSNSNNNGINNYISSKQQQALVTNGSKRQRMFHFDIFTHEYDVSVYESACAFVPMRLYKRYFH